MADLLFKLSGLTGARLLGSVAAFLSSIVISRLYGTDALAAYAIWMSVAGVLSVVMPAGAQSMAPILVSKAVAGNDRSQATSILRFGYASILICTFMTVVTGLIWIHWIDKSHEQSVWLVFLAATCIAPLMALVHLHAGALNGMQRHLSGQLPDSLMKPIVFLALLTMATVFFDPEAKSIIIAALAASLMLAITLQSFSLRAGLYRIRPSAGKRPSHKLSFGKSTSWLSISLLWDYQIEILMIALAMVADPTDIALLYVCFRIRVLAGFGIKTIYQVFQPLIFAADMVKDRRLVDEQVHRINLFSMAYSLLVLSAILAFGSTALGLFDTKFSDSGSILVIICSALLARAAFGPGITVMCASGHQQTVAIALAIGTFLSVICSLVGYISHGPIAVAIVYAVINGLVAAYLRTAARQQFDIDTRISFPIRSGFFFKGISIGKSMS